MAFCLVVFLLTVASQDVPTATPQDVPTATPQDVPTAASSAITMEIQSLDAWHHILVWKTKTMSEGCVEWKVEGQYQFDMHCALDTTLDHHVKVGPLPVGMVKIRVGSRNGQWSEFRTIEVTKKHLRLHSDNSEGIYLVCAVFAFVMAGAVAGTLWHCWYSKQGHDDSSFIM